MKRLLLAILLLALPALATAQTITPPISAVRIVVSGGVSPVTNDLPWTSLQCALPKSAEPAVVAGVTHNATEVDFDDPAAPTTLYCKFKDTGVAPSPLIALPFGATTYTAVGMFVYGSAGPGPASAVSNPFDHPGVPGTTALSGLRVTP